MTAAQMIRKEAENLWDYSNEVDSVLTMRVLRAAAQRLHGIANEIDRQSTAPHNPTEDTR